MCVFSAGLLDLEPRWELGVEWLKLTMPSSSNMSTYLGWKWWLWCFGEGNAFAALSS